MMKVFGIGLPRTGTTSIAYAMLELGFKTAHTCFFDDTYERGDAFFDTPIYTDYPSLDYRFPGSKFILTWRDPEKWVESFQKNLGHYLNRLRTTDLYKVDYVSAANWRCYMQVFGPSTLESRDYLIKRYIQHREQAEFYFRNRPRDLLILPIGGGEAMGWDKLCDFLDVPVPQTPFPHVNTGGLDDWHSLKHANKI